MVDAARNALLLWSTQLVPSLFPFMILSSLFLRLSSQYPLFRCKNIFGISIHGVYILFLGNICGYPLGAKMTADAFNDQKISRSEADYLMTICNQSSPAFIEFYISVYALDRIISGHMILLLFLSGTILTAFITKMIYNPTPQKDTKASFNAPVDKTNFFRLLDMCISESCKTILQIGGYMILFSILGDFILSLKLLPDSFACILTSSLEITNGLHLLKTNFQSNPYYIYYILSLSAFGGFCTMAQIKGMLIGTPLSIKPYIIGKAIYTIVILLLFILLVQINVIHI